jgi:hypothetical protein
MFLAAVEADDDVVLAPEAALEDDEELELELPHAASAAAETTARPASSALRRADR